MVERKADVVHLRRIREACRTCNLRGLCLPGALEIADMDALDNIVQRLRPLSRGDVLYRDGVSFNAIYTVRTGALKSMSVSEDGEEWITAFHLPGELVGLDSIGSDTHRSTACALETTSICEIPFMELEKLAKEIPGLQRQLLRIMSREIFSDQKMLYTLARCSAEQRLATLLIDLSDRFSRRGLSATRFCLPMSRHELSNYLGVAPETMSRLFRRFTENTWITAAGKEVSLEDPRELRAMASGGTATMQRKAGRAERVE